MENKELPFGYNPRLIIPKGDAAYLFQEMLKGIEQYPSCRVGHYFSDGEVVCGEAGKVVTVTIKKENYGE